MDYGRSRGVATWTILSDEGGARKMIGLIKTKLGGQEEELKEKREKAKRSEAEEKKKKKKKEWEKNEKRRRGKETRKDQRVSKGIDQIRVNGDVDDEDVANQN